MKMHHPKMISRFSMKWPDKMPEKTKLSAKPSSTNFSTTFFAEDFEVRVKSSNSFSKNPFGFEPLNFNKFYLKQIYFTSFQFQISFLNPFLTCHETERFPSIVL